MGWFARPLSWRAVAALVTFGVVFLVLDIVTAMWAQYTQSQIYVLLTLSGTVPDSKGVLGIATACAAFLGALIFAARVAFSGSREAHEP